MTKILANNVHYNITAIVECENEPSNLLGGVLDYYELLVSDGTDFKIVCTQNAPEPGLSLLTLSAVIMGNPTPNLCVRAVYKAVPEVAELTPVQQAMAELTDTLEGNPEALEALDQLRLALSEN